ncbi:MAG: hypothetical protein QF828_12540 [Pseudomonadales bacterium]|nr:hypothetical protein [Pseudomonadales bacterium]
MHEEGFTIHKNFEGIWYFRHGNGKIMPEGLVYEPTMYDASGRPSGDAFVDQDYVREPARTYSIRPVFDGIYTDSHVAFADVVSSGVESSGIRKLMISSGVGERTGTFCFRC